MRLLWPLIDWFALPVLAILVVLLIVRKVPRQYPYFFYYLIVGELIGLVRLLLYDPASRVYFYVYYTTDVLFAVFAFLAAYELFVKRLFPRFHAVRLYRYLFPAAALIITLISVPAAILAHKGAIFLPLTHGLGVLRVTLLLFFVGLMLLMGRRWSRYELGIALGLIIHASAFLVTSAVWARLPFRKNVLDRLPVMVYDLACTIWLITFLKPEKPTPEASSPISPEILTEARKWEATLKDSLSRKKGPD